MSTKIYYAWRFHIGELQTFILQTNNQVFDIAEERVRKLMAAVRQEAALARLKKAERSPELEQAARLRMVFEQCLAASKALKRDLAFCIDFGFNIWPVATYGYAIPIGEHWITEAIKPPGIEYGYWNNTDKPDEVSDAEWDERAKVWKGVCLDDHNAMRLWRSIIDVKEQIGIWELAKRILPTDDERWYGTALLTAAELTDEV